MYNKYLRAFGYAVAVGKSSSALILFVLAAENKGDGNIIEKSHESIARSANSSVSLFTASELRTNFNTVQDHLSYSLYFKFEKKILFAQIPYREKCLCACT